MGSVFLQGWALSLGLIVAIGAQNAFVLRQGLRREHVASVVFFCAITDALLIAAGVLGMAQALGESPMVANVLALQRSILDPLFAPGVSARLLEAPLKAPKGVNPLSLAQVHDSLQQAIWSEAIAGQEASLLRRNLQREHLRRVTDVLVKPSGNMPSVLVTRSPSRSFRMSNGPKISFGSEKRVSM